MSEKHQNKTVENQIELKIPNKGTADTFKKSDEGKDLHDVSDADELFVELDS